MKRSSLILRNYLTKRIILNFLPILAILFFIISGNQLYLVVNQSLNEGILTSELFPLILLKGLRDLPFLVSLSFSIALIYTFNKLYKNSEMIILNNAGLDDLKTIKLIMPLILLISLFALMLSIQLVPTVKYNIENFKEEIKSRPDYIFFKAGIFQKFNNLDITFYSKSIDSKGDSQFLSDVFIFDEKQNKVILSKTGIKKVDAKTKNVFLILNDGRIYENFHLEVENQESITSFKVLTINMFEPKKFHSFLNKNYEHKTLLEIISSIDLKGLKELLNRLNPSISIIIFSLFSLMICKNNTRSRFNFSLGYGFMGFIGYYNLIAFIEENMSDNFNEVIILFLLPHLLMIFTMFIIYNLQNNFILFGKRLS